MVAVGGHVVVFVSDRLARLACAEGSHLHAIALDDDAVHLGERLAIDGRRRQHEAHCSLQLALLGRSHLQVFHGCGRRGQRTLLDAEVVQEQPVAVGLGSIVVEAEAIGHLFVERQIIGAGLEVVSLRLKGRLEGLRKLGGVVALAVFHLEGVDPVGGCVADIKLDDILSSGQEMDGGRDEPVVVAVVCAVLAAHTSIVGITPSPCQSVVVGVDDRENIGIIGRGERSLPVRLDGLVGTTKRGLHLLGGHLLLLYHRRVHSGEARCVREDHGCGCLLDCWCVVRLCQR